MFGIEGVVWAVVVVTLVVVVFVVETRCVECRRGSTTCWDCVGLVGGWRIPGRDSVSLNRIEWDGMRLNVLDECVVDLLCV